MASSDLTKLYQVIAAEGQEADRRGCDEKISWANCAGDALPLLERLLAILSRALTTSQTADAMQKAQEESRHLQFACEVGLEVQSGGLVWVKDLWTVANWYEGMGILDKDNDKGEAGFGMNFQINMMPVKAIEPVVVKVSLKFSLHPSTPLRWAGRSRSERQRYLFELI